MRKVEEVWIKVKYVAAGKNCLFNLQHGTHRIPAKSMMAGVFIFGEIIWARMLDSFHHQIA
jgi:hypothetical protein